MDWHRARLAGRAWLAAALALGLASGGPSLVAAQTSDAYEIFGNSPSPEYRAATVVTNLWIAAFAVTSAVFAVFGLVVALQWPRPRCLCYKTPLSDMPSSSSSRSCCSLYSLNLGFLVFWLLVLAIMIISRDLIRIIVCLCFFLVHTGVIIIFRVKFNRFGRPERPLPPQPELVAVPGGGYVTSGPAGGPTGGWGRPAVAQGIPIYEIPLQTVVVGGPSHSMSQQQQQQQQQQQHAGSPYPSWQVADAVCSPPQQQAGMAGYPGSSGPAAAGATGGYAAVGLASPGAAAAAYPPQPGAHVGSSQAWDQLPYPVYAAPASVGRPVPAAAAGGAGGAPAAGQPMLPGSPYPSASPAAAAAAAGAGAGAAGGAPVVRQ